MEKVYSKTSFNTPDFLARLKNGDRSAFRELVEHFQGKVYNLALKILWNKEDAEDVLQETFLKVVDKIGTFREESDIGTWIYRIATNAALMKLRERQRQRGLIAELTDVENQEIQPSRLAPEVTNPFDDLLKKESREILQTAIENLPDIYRVVFILKDVENLSTDEIASILDLSHEAIYSRLKRARMRLREAVLTAYKEKYGEGSYALS
ncbi:MAG: sigma-70 family RNA polymerase sigma factor [candidate division KSB1 bacterium]|nr:sigma-70 family RNA polymerase sigma factor [candidate division KSB1 bacterium]MDQ7064309.1 sigma-70 family RNA polymerase sigma factor [candidate division KSB1 bacterium]